MTATIFLKIRNIQKTSSRNSALSIDIKIHLRLECYHLQKFSFNWNITMSNYFIYKINIRGSFALNCPW